MASSLENGKSNGNAENAFARQIVAEQRKFFKSGETRCIKFREQQLQKLAEMVEKNHGQLCAAIHKDLRRDNLFDEIGITAQCIRHCAASVQQWAAPEKLDEHPFGEPEIVHEPKGVLLALTTWNYPVNLVLQPVAEAMAAGNTVVIKLSEVAPNTSHLLKQLIDANFEKKYVAALEGDAELAQALLKERFDHIFYTGNSTVGKVIMQAAAKHLTPVTLELGGKSPAVVVEGADLEKAAQRIVEAKWLNNGQTCMVPDYVLTTPGSKPKLLEQMKKHLAQLYGENPQQSAHYSRLVNQRHFDRLSSLLANSSGQVVFKPGKPNREDCYMPPTIVDTDWSDVLMQAELFGPILPIVCVKGIKEAMEVIGGREKPLAAYLFTEDQKIVDKFVRGTSSGGICINDCIKQVLVNDLPFGGIGNSGIGRYHGRQGFLEFSHGKGVLKRKG